MNTLARTVPKGDPIDTSSIENIKKQEKEAVTCFVLLPQTRNIIEKFMNA